MGRCRHAAPLADAPVPRVRRPIVELRVAQRPELHRVEEVLVAAALAAGQSVYRSPSAPPAVVLGVWVADKVSRAA